VQIKWLEDFVMLAKTRSFTRSAELRNVTHPAFGRRIKSLEAWAGTPLIARDNQKPVRLTAAGEALLEFAEETLRGLQGARENMLIAAGKNERSVVLVTGRTLARTMVPDWLVRLRGLLDEADLHIRTDSLASVAQVLERGDADFALLYHHAALAVKLDPRQFTHMTVATDRLVPVARADAEGRPLFSLLDDKPVPYLAYASTLAMGRLVADHLANHPAAPLLRRRIECDSADAQHEYVERGLGVAWLPWSMAHPSCKSGLMAPAGDRKMEVRFEVRLYRAKKKLSSVAESIWSRWTK
jgi:DNA-binding transcriptional LysR family regulator